MKDFDALTAAEIAARNRELALTTAAPDLRVAYLGDSTLDLLPAYVNVCASQQGLALSSYVGAFGQHFQEVLSQDSGLQAFGPDVIFLAARSDTDAWIDAALQNSSATLLVCNAPHPHWTKAGLADLVADGGATETRLSANLELLRRLKGESRAHYFDLDAALAETGRDAFDPKMHYLARMAWSERALPAIARLIVRHLRATAGRARKCLVLDLDNTLWGGVVGEDGVDGIRIGHGDPVAEAFWDLQLRCKAIQERGVLLAICSKNNPADVEEVFRQREMPLKESDFAATQINWDHKHENLRRIAETLNIGTDALVFVDDNPAETELVRQMMPEVRVVLLPKDPALRPQAVEQMDEFEKYAILDEDRKKTERYRDNRQREEHKSEAGDLSAYLESLETSIAIRTPAQADLARVHQLFTKTNQFNLTTIRYSTAEVEGFSIDDACTLRIVEAKDRFGELGVIGLYLLRRSPDHTDIDSFVLSCRAMGRGIETAMMNDIKARGETMHGCYRPTGKNVPAQEFFEREGFSATSQAGDGGKDYVLANVDIQPGDCDWIEIRSM